MRVGIVSGYFALGVHEGHLDLLNTVEELNDIVVIIINNDEQVQAKYGFIPLDCWTRKRIIEKISDNFDVMISTDIDGSVAYSLSKVVDRYGPMSYMDPEQTIPLIHFTFYNSGDRSESNANAKELEICESLDIKVEYLDMPKRGSSSDLIKKIKEQGIKETRIANGEYIFDLSQHAKANYELNKTLWENDPNNKFKRSPLERDLKPGDIGYA